jgi:hypothetical protein
MEEKSRVKMLSDQRKDGHFCEKSRQTVKMAAVGSSQIFHRFIGYSEDSDDFDGF